VTALGECVNYAFDRRNSASALKKFFRRMHDAIEPGGVFIFDAAEPGLVGARPARTWLAGDDWAILLDLTENTRQRTATRRMSVFRKVGGTWRRSEEEHPLRLCRRQELKGWLEHAGFEVEVVGGYGKPFRRALVGFVCKRVG
jgi:hypothetical protein